MPIINNLLRFDKGKVSLRHSILADLWGMNFTLGKRIFLTGKAWRLVKNLDEVIPGQSAVCALLNHEYCHYEQQIRIGFLRFLFLYLFCLPLFYNPWRLRLELEAYKVTLAWYVYIDAPVDEAVTQIATRLSSWRYGLIISRKRALYLLNSTLEELLALKNANLPEKTVDKS